MNPAAANKAITEQQTRCSDQHHLWRQRTTFGLTHMGCRCGAVHPDDLDAFIDAYLDQRPSPASAVPEAGERA